MKNPWPLALTIFIGGAFAFSVYIAVTMIRQNVDLVAPDYYEQDLQHGERMAQEARARGLEQGLRVRLHAEARQVEIDFPDAAATGSITFFRPSDGSMDRTFEIKPEEDGRQIIPIVGWASGLWRVQISWRQQGLAFYFAEPLVLP